MKKLVYPFLFFVLCACILAPPCHANARACCAGCQEGGAADTACLEAVYQNMCELAPDEMRPPPNPFRGYTEAEQRELFPEVLATFTRMWESGEITYTFSMEPLSENDLVPGLSRKDLETLSRMVVDRKCPALFQMLRNSIPEDVATQVGKLKRSLSFGEKPRRLKEFPGVIEFFGVENSQALSGVLIILGSDFDQYIEGYGDPWVLPGALKRYSGDSSALAGLVPTRINDRSEFPYVISGKLKASCPKLKDSNEFLIKVQVNGGQELLRQTLTKAIGGSTLAVINIWAGASSEAERSGAIVHVLRHYLDSLATPIKSDNPPRSSNTDALAKLRPEVKKRLAELFPEAAGLLENPNKSPDMQNDAARKMISVIQDLTAGKLLEEARNEPMVLERIPPCQQLLQSTEYRLYMEYLFRDAEKDPGTPIPDDLAHETCLLVESKFNQLLAMNLKVQTQEEHRAFADQVRFLRSRYNLTKDEVLSVFLAEYKTQAKLRQGKEVTVTFPYPKTLIKFFSDLYDQAQIK